MLPYFNLKIACVCKDHFRLQWFCVRDSSGKPARRHDGQLGTNSPTAETEARAKAEARVSGGTPKQETVSANGEQARRGMQNREQKTANRANNYSNKRRICWSICANQSSGLMVRQLSEVSNKMYCCMRTCSKSRTTWGMKLMPTIQPSWSLSS